MFAAPRVRRVPLTNLRLLPLVLVLATAGALSGVGPAASAAATAPPGYQVVNGMLIPTPAASVVSDHVDCPAGTVIWGGGGFATQPLSPGENINSSLPGGHHKGWNVQYNNASAQNRSVGVRAICAKKPARYTVRTATVDLPGRSQAVATVTCPKGTVLYDGGIATTENSTRAFVLGAYPQGNTAYSSIVWNGTPTDAQLTATAICGAKPPRYKVLAADSIDDTPGPVTLVSAKQCPDGTAVIGGGIQVAHPQPAVEVAASVVDSGVQWLAELMNVGIQGVESTTYAICAA